MTLKGHNAHSFKLNCVFRSSPWKFEWR